MKRAFLLIRLSLLFTSVANLSKEATFLFYYTIRIKKKKAKQIPRALNEEL